MLEWAIQTLEAAGVESPRLEAQLLLAHVLGISRAAVVAQLYSDPDEAQREAFRHLVEQRARRVPLAYLRGWQEFYGLPFAVTPAVLIPRPETELLVTFALEKLKERQEARGMRHEDASLRPPTFADVGTGSGCIVTAVLKHDEAARAVAFDISKEALALARNNAQKNGVTERVRFVHGSLLGSAGTGRFDVIVSNPPYIPTGEIPTLQPEVRDYEPRLALDGGQDGLDAHRHLAAEVRRALRLEGWLAVEVAMGQAPAVVEIFRRGGLESVEIRQDLAGIARVVAGQKVE